MPRVRFIKEMGAGGTNINSNLWFPSARPNAVHKLGGRC